MNHASLSDSHCVTRSCAGDEEAFAELVNRHWMRLHRFVSGIVRDQDDVEDVLQEAFVRAFRSLGDLQEPARFSTWVTSIARNTALKAIRHREMARRGLDRTDVVVPVDGRDGEAGFSGPAVRRGLASLPGAVRETMTLFYLLGFDQARIGALLNIPVGTVKSRLHRGRQALKRSLTTMKQTQLKEDYGRAVIGGMRGLIQWRKLLAEEGLDGWQLEKGNEGAWERSGEAIIGSDEGGTGAFLVTGERTWHDYELSVLVTPISGGNAQIFFRVSEDQRSWYLLDFLLGWQAIAISRVDDGQLTKLSVVNFPIETGTEYDVMIAAREASLTSYVDGKLVNDVTDFTHRTGPIALNAWNCKTAFRDPRIRLMH